MELGDQIRIAREAAGWTKEELAANIGVTKQAIIWWENNIHHPRLPLLAKIEGLLKTRFNATGTKGLTDTDLTGIKPEYVRVAVSISQLSKANREAIITLVTALTAKSKV